MIDAPEITQYQGISRGTEPWRDVGGRGKTDERTLTDVLDDLRDAQQEATNGLGILFDGLARGIFDRPQCRSQLGAIFDRLGAAIEKKLTLEGRDVGGQG